MSGEGFAFNIWYIQKFGPHAPIAFPGCTVRFTPVKDLMDWYEGTR